MSNARFKAQKQYEEREIRPTKRLTLAEVPARPDISPSFSKHGYSVWDAPHDGHPCRWRVDEHGLRTFIRYYQDHETANAFPWKELYERGRTGIGAH